MLRFLQAPLHVATGCWTQMKSAREMALGVTLQRVSVSLGITQVFLKRLIACVQTKSHRSQQMCHIHFFKLIFAL